MSFFDVPDFIVDVGVGNDKIITVPTNETWKLLGVYIRFSTSGDAGLRVLRLSVRNPSDGILVLVEWSENQSVSVSKSYVAAPDMRAIDDVTGVVLFTPLPHMRLGPGFDIRVFDTIDVSASDTINMSVNITRDTEQ